MLQRQHVQSHIPAERGRTMFTTCATAQLAKYRQLGEGSLFSLHATSWRPKAYPKSLSLF